MATGLPSLQMFLLGAPGLILVRMISLLYLSTSTKFSSWPHYLTTMDTPKYHAECPKGKRGRQQRMADPLPSSPAAPYGLGIRGLQKSNNIFGAHPDLTEPSVKTQLAREGVVGYTVATD